MNSFWALFIKPVLSRLSASGLIIFLCNTNIQAAPTNHDDCADCQTAHIGMAIVSIRDSYSREILHKDDVELYLTNDTDNANYQWSGQAEDGDTIALTFNEYHEVIQVTDSRIQPEPFESGSFDLIAFDDTYAINVYYIQIMVNNPQSEFYDKLLLVRYEVLIE